VEIISSCVSLGGDIVDQYSKFSHLSVRDLVEARDQFHVHLMNKRNVVATAIGRYLIRLSDLGEDGKYKPTPSDGPVQKPKRTLDNSMVIDISWPCVLVFVEKWQDEIDLVKHSGENIVPKTIYMPDGRVVPVCIVEAPREASAATEIDPDRLRFPDNLIGGGFPLLMHSQGVDWLATVGCLVADGHRYYALTNKHVTGEGGEPVYSRFGADRRQIGVASGKTLGKVSFSKLYEEWNTRNLYVNCDIGLVEIEDLRRWKTDVVGLGQIGELYDLNTQNIDLSLIAEHNLQGGKRKSTNGRVIGCGAVSGRMEGELLALFYRYKAVGGKEYISDFLIGGRDGQALSVHHGDSGALWLLETQDEDKKTQLRPIALHWGQHEFLEAGGKSHSTYSLATCLSNVCRELDVELIRDWNLSLDYSWGKVGHYTVATFAVTAIDVVTGDGGGFDEFKQFMKNNLGNISFPRTKVDAGLDTKKNPLLSTNPEQGFCPLADVPDIIWKQSKKKTTWGRQGDENPNHYADADAPTVHNGNLFEACKDQSKLTTEAWMDYYNDIDPEKTGLDPKTISHGLICFRAWQIFKYMVEALEARKLDKFIFAAGVLAHYVGDACQPLHSSYMSNGDPADNRTIDYTAKRDSPPMSKHPHKKGDVYQKTVNPGGGVHAAYEDAMIDDKIDEILTALGKVLEDKNSRIRKELIDPIDSGRSAGFAVLKLMQKTQEDIAPRDIVELYKKIKGQTTVSDALYEKFGAATSECMARGCLYLASIWKAAWVAGHGNTNLEDNAAVQSGKLSILYANRLELESKHLDTIDEVLTRA
jgi:hypothetical protein